MKKINILFFRYCYTYGYIWPNLILIDIYHLKKILRNGGNEMSKIAVLKYHSHIREGLENSKNRFRKTGYHPLRWVRWKITFTWLRRYKQRGERRGWIKVRLNRKLT